MIVDPDFLDHWRTRMVVDALGDEFAPFYLLRLWGHCQQRKSDTFDIPTAGLKALCRAAADADALEAALIAAGFIERTGNTVRVLKWADHNASLLAAWDNGHKGGRPKKEPNQNPRVTASEPSGNPAVTQREPSENPRETDKSREDKRSTSLSGSKARERAHTLECPEDVNCQTWVDWLELRAKKRAPVTLTVVANARTEAIKAGMTLTDFLAVWCARGSQGLQAEWLKDRGGGVVSKQTALEARNRAVAEEFLRDAHETH